MTLDEITHIITSELESSDHVEWSHSPQTGRFAIEGRYGSMELMPVMLAGFPYVAFGSSHEDHPYTKPAGTTEWRNHAHLKNIIHGMCA